MVLPCKDDNVFRPKQKLFLGPAVFSPGQFRLRMQIGDGRRNSSRAGNYKTLSGRHLGLPFRSQTRIKNSRDGLSTFPYPYPITLLTRITIHCFIPTSQYPQMAVNYSSFKLLYYEERMVNHQWAWVKSASLVEGPLWPVRAWVCNII